MHTFESIKARRAVQHYDPDFAISSADEARLFDLAMHSPTSFNMQNWRFVVVKDKALRKKIRAAAMDQAQITEASLLVVLCADMHAWNKEPSRYWKHAPAAVQDKLVPLIAPFYEGREQLQRDEAMRSIGIAAQTIMLAAKAMGYDSCPMIGFDQEAVAKLIRLPEDHVLGMIVTVGKAARDSFAKGISVPGEEVVIRDRFQ